MGGYSDYVLKAHVDRNIHPEKFGQLFILKGHGTGTETPVTQCVGK